MPKRKQIVHKRKTRKDEDPIKTKRGREKTRPDGFIIQDRNKLQKAKDEGEDRPRPRPKSKTKTS